jgi:F-type H+-transporting ATPase subunit delta
VAEVTSLVSGVAERYATALFELALDADALAATEGDIDRFAALLAESEDLKRLVRSPAFSADEQLRAIAAVLDKAGIGGLVANLVKVTAANRRLFTLPDVIAAFKRLAADHRGEIAAAVTSAEPLADGQVDSLKAALKEALGKDVTLEARVDPSLIGGLIVNVGSRMIDGSLRTKLNGLRLAMKEVG